MNAVEPGTTASDAESDSTEDITTLMVIDDNEDLRAYVSRHLSRSYRVVAYADGDSALGALPDVLPDLIVCDLMMPGIDGFAFCAAVKANPAFDFIPIILLTARAEKTDRLDAWSEGADDYVTKPFDMAELEARVRNLIASRRKLRDRLRESRVISPSRRDVVSADERYLEQVRAAIEARLDDEELTVDALAEAVGQSRVQLYRRLQTLIGRAPSELIREVRLGHAAQLLTGAAGTVSEIAYAVGFKSVSHFCRSFREVFGDSPAQFMARQRHAPSHRTPKSSGT